MPITSTPIPFGASALGRVARVSSYGGTLTASNAGGPMFVREEWTAAIDTTNLWLATVGATGAIAKTAGGLVASYVSGRGRLNLPAAADTANLTSLAEIYNPGGTASAAASKYKKLIAEWEMSLLTVANIVNSSFFAGFCSVGNGTGSRTSRDIAGFGLASDAFVAVVDADSTESTDTTTFASVTTTNHAVHLYRVELSKGLAVLSVDGVQASFTSNVPLLSEFFVVNAVSEVGAAAIFLGPISVWGEDE